MRNVLYTIFTIIVVFVLVMEIGSISSQENVSPSYDTVGYTMDNVTVVGINPPKHFSVDVMTSKGTAYRGVASSKHCSDARKLNVGDSFAIPVRIAQTPDGKLHRFHDFEALNTIICD